MNLEPAILDLIIERTTYGLSVADQSKLDQLIQSSPDPQAILREAQRFELSIAALELSQLNPSSSTEPSPSLSETPLSPALLEKIRRQSTEALESFSAPDDHQPVVTAERTKHSAGFARTSRRLGFKEIFIWTVAAASLLALAMFIRQSNQSTDPEQLITENLTVPEIDLVEDIMPSDEQMKKFLGSSPEDLLTLSWTPVDNENVTGEVFWSDQRQTGFMALNGLEINDPQQQQYQVWIYDTDAKEPRPINGGVFDVPKTGRYVVPIAPLSPVKEAVQFAITAEQPGGVEVSDRKHVPTVTAKPF